MPALKNPMEIFKLLNRSNCRDCNAATCLAFAAAVYQGQRPLADCPHLAPEIIERFEGKVERTASIEEDMQAAAARLRDRLRTIDLAVAARRLGAGYSSGNITLRILGKDFRVAADGNMFSDIHVHPWVAIPVLNYIIDGAGKVPSGNWVPLRELPSGKEWRRLFEQRCEKPLKRVADSYPDLFEDMIHIFNGRQVENHYQSDISLVLLPLPRLPVLVCYWKPDEGLASSLNLFFDSTAEDNLKMESIYALGAGLSHMFEKIALRHGIQPHSS